MRQGDVYLADLNPVKGHEQAGYRPVLVLQNDVLNKNLNTAIVVPITSNLKAKGKLTTCFLPKNKSGLVKDSVVLLFQLRTLDKQRLAKRITSLDAKTTKDVLNQLRFVF